MTADSGSLGANDIDSRSPEHTRDSAERLVRKAAKLAERVLDQGLELFRTRASAYSNDPRTILEDAQREVVAWIRERPVTAAVSGVGVGILLGFLLSGRDR
jgi:ElaB/YqjD/DUF883 family membrane-anchored ribosome-binding protein